MASVKLAQLVIRTLAKPISTSLKKQAKEHPGFRAATISFAQWIHKAEINARTGLLREAAPKVRMLNDETAIEKGANFLSESFLFLVAAGLILGETLRSSRANTKRRDRVDDELSALREEVDRLRIQSQKRSDEDRQRLIAIDDSDRAIASVVEHLVDTLRKAGRTERIDKDPAWQRETQALHERVTRSVSSSPEPA